MCSEGNCLLSSLFLNQIARCLITSDKANMQFSIKRSEISTIIQVHLFLSLFNLSFGWVDIYARLVMESVIRSLLWPMIYYSPFCCSAIYLVFSCCLWFSKFLFKLWIASLVQAPIFHRVAMTAVDLFFFSHCWWSVQLQSFRFGWNLSRILRCTLYGGTDAFSSLRLFVLYYISHFIFLVVSEFQINIILTNPHPAVNLVISSHASSFG